ncbi:hypothetical protein, conserved [Trypanosoma vivax Y486]|uniref:MGT2 magnesium transporter n=1 Tax=Trypanosoma vivax (strain Y486) TaxID=1055687 RepID=F9WS01_TRYVY|nr:hypothetical protein, conserved [Trypanosoma vivax Y486]|eukprot:CCD20338.1 hypothetical protein, conserved [Trypanosoma vivax Y486]
MQPSHADAVLASDIHDVAELQAGHGEYVVGCLACSRDRGGPFLSSAPTEVAGDSDEVVLCSFACDERRLLTLHASPFVGLSEALRSAECDCPAANASSHSEGVKALSAAALLCALVCFTCEARLPDTTPLVTEVDCIDEMMMLVAPGKSDQTDMLRRVALLRRRLSSTTRQLRAKEGLLQELVGPTMRTSFVSRDASVVSSYREAFDELWPVLECLECASDAVNHASLNFMYAISMRMSQASAGFDYQMMIINKIVTVCLPANLLCSLFGMNCRVAWQADEQADLRAFWGIIGLISLWLAVCLFRPVRDFLRWRGA